MSEQVFATGKMVVGCNYWASHAGTAMWRDWRPEIVAADFARIAAAGLQLVRIFPLWPDFQPLTLLRCGGGHPFELRNGEERLEDSPAGRAGVDPLMMERFRLVADLAAKNGLQLEVALLNGWMSGRLFVPAALSHLDVLTDPQAILWETRYVRYFVRTMKDHPAIAAWSPGNECNCMGVADRHQAWGWMNTIVSAIRLEDPTRPITSGMHSLVPAADNGMERKNWTIQDQAEHADVLTTHPYPEFTPHAKRDPVNRFRNAFHATAECLFYSDIGGKPALAEELGTLAAMYAGEAVKAAYVRNTLYNLWAHDCRGLIWWCAFDQLHLEQAPYDWTAVERELGLFYSDGQAKPVLAEFTAFRRQLDALPFRQLPRCRRQAVCILTRDQDSWGNAWSAFLLAKQAGFDLEFQYAADSLKSADLYLLPGLDSGIAISRTQWLELLRRVDAGATLYASYGRGMTAPFNDVFGVEVQSREERTEPVEWEYAGMTFRTAAEFKSVLAVRDAEVLARETDGNPLFLRHNYGQGQTYLMMAPVEKYLAETAGLFPAAASVPFYKIYQEFAAPQLRQRLVHTGNPLVTATEHFFSDREAVVVLVNNQPDAVELQPEFASGWKVEKLFGDSTRIGGNDAAAVRLSK